MMPHKQPRLFSIERRGQSGVAALSSANTNMDSQAAALGEAGIAKILEELAALREEVNSIHKDQTRIANEDDDMKRDVRVEVAQMVRSIGHAKTQIAAIKNPVDGTDEVEKASLQLEEITKATEAATDDIMSATDEVEQILKEIHAHTVEDPDIAPLVDKAGEKLIEIIEACAFQDLTGQRVTQVVKTLRFIESRVLSMIDIWGLEAFQDVDLSDGVESNADGEGDGEVEGSEDDEALLNGPALGGQGLSQADIDALFD